MKNNYTTKISTNLFRWLFCALFLLGINTMRAQYSNVPVTGYNNDIIASPDGSFATNTASTGTTPGVTYPTIGVDGNGPGAYTLVSSDYKWYSGGTLATCGLVSGGSYASASTSGLTYVLQSTTANNAMSMISNTYSGSVLPTSVTATLVTPARYTNLYVMYESVLNAGAPTITATITFTDLSTQVIPGNVLVNWFTTPAAGNLAYSGNMQRTNNAAPGALSTCQTTGPILFQMNLPVSPANYSKFVQSITFAYSHAIGTSVGTVNYFHALAFGGLAPCTTPADQASGLTQGATTTSSIAGSFTAAGSAPTGYLVVGYPTGATPVAPVNGTTYVAGQSIGSGQVIQASASTSFSASGLSGGAAYDVYIYSYNSGATCGGPQYNTTTVPSATWSTTACSGLAGGTYSVGPTGTYPSITAAMTAVNAGISGPVILELQAAYTSAVAGEVFPITFPSNACIGLMNSLTIRPETGATALSITGASATGILNFNAARYITIDGRAGGAGVSQLTITNTGTGYAAQFINDALFNSIKYCTVTSRNVTTTSGTIVFGTGTVYGNDANSIDNCSITDDGNGTTFPANAIYSAGTSAAIDNSSNSITNNNISNFFSAGSATNGILLTGTGNSAWTITSNKLFQTAIRVYTTANTHNGISVLVGSNYTISNNTIGYANSSGTGYYSMIGNSVTLAGFPTNYAVTGTATATRFVAINCAFTAAGTTSNIQGNTVAGIAIYTSSGANTTFGVLCGIQLTSGNVNIGTTTGNTIGATSSLGSLYSACTTTGGTIVGIYATSANTVTIQNNTIGACDASGSSATINGGITGIDLAGTATYSITSNTIGNATAGNMRTGFIQNGANLGAGGATLTSTTGATAALLGIRSAATGVTLAVNSNTVQGFITSGTVSSFTGITSTGANTLAQTFNNNFIGTTAAGLINYTVASSGTLLGINVTGSTGAISHSIQNNDFRGITQTAATGSNTQTYITFTAGTSNGDVTTISNNTFTNLNVNTTGTVTLISHSYTVGNGGVQTINNNSIVTALNKSGASGGVVCQTSGGSTILATAFVSHTNNNYSNITVSGTTTITGINNTDGLTTTAINRTITGNILNNWTAGTGAVTGMTYTYWGGTTSTLSNNTITNITGQGAITGLSIGNSGLTANPLTVATNTITGLSSTGAGGAVTGLTCANASPVVNINGNIINTLSSTGASSTVAGLTITGAAITNVFQNTINTLSGSGATSPIIQGIAVSGGTTVNVYRNKVYDLSESAAISTTAGAVTGIVISAGTTVNTYNNIIGDLRAPAAVLADAIRGISVTSATASTSYNVYYNNVYINASSSGGTFGTTGIYHTANATTTTAKLDLRNNIVINISTPAGTGITSALRRSAAATLGNYASTSNRNLLYAGTPGANNLIMYDGTNSYSTFGPAATAGTYQNIVSTRDANSITGEGFAYSTAGTFFQSLTGSNANFLHIVAGANTQVESGASVITTPAITQDYDADTRNVSAPDIGADEFVGVTPAPSVVLNSVAPSGTQCAATARAVAVDATTPSGTITGVTIDYSYNGISQGSFAMTNSVGNTWTYTIPAATPTNASVTWTATATNSASLTSSYSGTAYSDDPLFVLAAVATSSASTICSGTSANLTATFSTVSATVGAGATTSATYSNPFYSLWSNTHNQHLILASELTAAGLYAGNITSLGLNITAPGTLPMLELSVKMANTSATNMSAYLSPSFTTVYTNASLMPTTGINTMTFTTPFVWDGTSNVVIEICHGNSASTATMSRTCTFDNTAYVSSIHTNKTVGTGGNSQCTDNTTGLLTYSGRPQFMFTVVRAANGYLWSNGATTSSISVSPTSNTDYSCALAVGTCTKTTNTVTVTTIALPSAPTGTPSTQCGLGIPTASVTSTSGAGAPQFYWYNAASAGTTLQGPPLSGSVSNYYSNNFASATLTNSSISGAASIAAGVLALQPTTTGTGGALTVNASGVNSNLFQTDFDLSATATGTSMADGFSYCIGDDVLPLNNGTTPTAEHGSGSKIRICFLTYNAASGSDGKGIYLGYGVSATTGFTSGTAGMLGYSTNVAWIPTSATTINSHVLLTINAAGQLSLTVGGNAIFTNVQLPAGYLSANKSTWKHIMSSRSGGVAGGFSMDNLVIQANTFGAGTATYLSSISTPTTFYVTEKDVTTGCESSPRTSVLANVTFGDAVAGVTQVNNSNVSSICMGTTFQLSTSQTGASLNNYTYTWTGSSANSGITGSVSGGSYSSPTTLNITPLAAGTYTYTVNYTDGFCNGLSTVLVTAYPNPSGVTASSNLSSVCTNGVVNLSSTGQSNIAGTPVSFTEGFETSFPTANWTYINAGTGNAWTTSTTTHSGSGAIQYSYNLSNAANAWAISPVQTLVAGQVYTVTFWYKVISASFPEKMKVTVGTLNTVAAQTTILWNNNGGATLTNTTYAQGTATFTPSTTGTYYFAWNCYSDLNEDILYVDDISITGPTMTPVTYSWASTPAGLSSTAQNPTNIAVSTNTTYTVTVSNSAGCTASSSTSVTTIALPTAPTANNSVQCGTQVPTASVTGTGGATFKWYNAASSGTLLQTSTSTTYTTPISVTTTFYVTEVSGICESSPRTPVIVTVNTAAPITATVSSSTVCVNSAVTIDWTSAFPDYDNTTYTVTSTSGSGASTPVTGVSIGSTATHSSGGIVTPTAAGTYIYTVSVYDGILCATTSTVSVTAIAGPVVNTPTASPSTICAATTSTLSATSYNTGPQTLPTGYCAGGGGTNFADEQIFAVSFGTMSNTQTETCGANYTSYIGTIAAPNVALGQSVPFSVTVNECDGATYYSNGLSIFIDLNRDGDFVDAGEKIYTTSALTQSPNTRSGNIVIPVTASAGLTRMRVVVIESTTSPDPCTAYTYGETEDYAINILGDATGSVAWSWAPGPISGSTVTVSPTATTTYTVSGLANGCSTTQTVTLNVTPIPTAPTANNSSQCGIGVPTASVTSTSGAGTPTFKWYNAASGGTLLQSSTSSTYTTSIGTSTTFYVTEIIGACESSPRTAVTVTNTADIIAIVSPSASCLGTPTSFSVSQTGNNQTFTSYTWGASPLSGSGLTGSETGISQTITPTATGTFTYSVVASDGSCIVTANKTVSVYPGLTGTAIASAQIVSCVNPTGLITANVSGAGTVVNNDFSSSTLPSYMTLQGSASITGGELVVTPTSSGQSGSILVQNTTGLANNEFQIDFDFITKGPAGVPFGGTAADGFSYSYGDDVVAGTYTGSGNAATTIGYPSGTATGNTAEGGSGTKLKISFDAWDNGVGTQSGNNGGENYAGIYFMYNCTDYFNATHSPTGTTAADNARGVLAFSPATWWRATSTQPASPVNTTHVTISMAGASPGHPNGTTTLVLTGNGGLAQGNVFGPVTVDLPAGYLAADKSTWKHVFAARTGGNWEGHSIKNLLIQYNNFYEYSIDGGSSWSLNNPIVPPTSGTYSVSARYVAVPACYANIGTAIITAPSFTTTTTANSVCSASPTQPGLSFSPAFGAGASYQWESSPAGANTWSDIGGATSITYTPTALASSTDFRCKISCGASQIPGSPTTIQTINVVTTPTVSATSNTPVCSGQTLNLTGTTDSGTLFAWTGPNGFTSSSQSPSISNVTTAGTGTYSLTTTFTGCSATATTAVLVNAPETIGTVTATPSSVCNGNSSVLAATAGIAGSTFSWSGTNLSSNSGASVTASNITATTTYTVTATAPVTGCSATSTVSVSVITAPVGSAANSTIGSGTATSISLSGGTTYSWAGSGNGATSGTANPIVETLTSTDNVNPTLTTYTVTPYTVEGCSGLPFTVDVTVNPAPTVTANNVTVCSGTSPAIAITASTGAGATFTWSSSGDANASGFNNCASGCGSTINELNLANLSSSVAAHVTYTIVPTSSLGVVGIPFPVNVTINPIPVGTATNYTVCTGGATSIALSSSTGGTSYTWTNNAGAGVTGASTCSTSCGSVITNTLTNVSGSAAQTVVYTVIPTANTCQGASFSSAVTVNQKNTAPTSIAATSPVVCVSSPGTILQQVGGQLGTGAVWAWYTTNSYTPASLVGTSSAADASLPVSRTVTTTYWVRAEGAAGPCTANLNGPTIGATVSVTTAAPARPTVVSGPQSLCNFTTPGAVATYTATAMSGATSYIWTLLPGMTAVSVGTNTVIAVTSNTVTTNNNKLNVTVDQNNFINGVVYVVASNACGNSASQQSLSLTLLPAVPGTITGPSSVCFTVPTTVVYNTTAAIASAYGVAQPYVWSVPSGMNITGGQGTSAITVDVTPSTAIAGNVTVFTQNPCGQSLTTASKAVTSATAALGAIGGNSGNDNICDNITSLASATFTVAPVVGATSYIWGIPAGANIVSGTGTTAITLTFTNAFAIKAQISVFATNGCKNTATVYKWLYKTPNTPASIAVVGASCTSGAVFTTPAVNGATSYNWTVPNGMCITGGQACTRFTTTTNTITTTKPGSPIGNVTVAAVNSCGVSAARTMAISCASPIFMNDEEAGIVTTIYPNPTVGDFTIELNSAVDKDLVIEVYDVLGKTIVSKTQTVTKDVVTKVNTNIEGYKNGIYLVRIVDKDNNIIYTQSVVKQ